MQKKNGYYKQEELKPIKRYVFCLYVLNLRFMCMCVCMSVHVLLITSYKYESVADPARDGGQGLFLE